MNPKISRRHQQVILIILGILLVLFFIVLIRSIFAIIGNQPFEPQPLQQLPTLVPTPTFVGAVLGILSF